LSDVPIKPLKNWSIQWMTQTMSCDYHFGIFRCSRMIFLSRKSGKTEEGYRIITRHADYPIGRGRNSTLDLAGSEKVDRATRILDQYLCLLETKFCILQMKWFTFMDIVI
jgi:hypothetical protein